MISEKDLEEYREKLGDFAREERLHQYAIAALSNPPITGSHLETNDAARNVWDVALGVEKLRAEAFEKVQEK